MSQKNSKKVALVVGATGTAGYGIVNHLLDTGEWEVIALSRNIRSSHKKNLKTMSVDLFNLEDLEEKLKGHSITHLFYMAMDRGYAFKSLKIIISVSFVKFWLSVAKFFLPLMDFILIPSLSIMYYDYIDGLAGCSDPKKKNIRMLQNVVKALEKTMSPLEHLSFISGGKYYGVHLGPNLYSKWKIPFEEDDPRYNKGKNYYYKMEDFIQSKAKEKNWSWTILRPNFIIGFSEGSPYNLGLALAIYASILKELNLPLIFPGDMKTYKATWEVCSATGLGRMFEWAIGKNQVFNYTSGRPFCWETVWPQLADHFNMEISLKKGGFSTINFFKKYGKDWEKIVQKYNLKNYKVRELVNPEFLENSMILDWDVVYSMEKAKKFGFCEEEEPSQIFLDLFSRLKERRIIPRSG